MNDYEFTLRFRLPDPATDAEARLEALAEAGCADALVGVGQPGRIALDFTRRARSAFDAVASAVRDKLMLGHAASFPAPVHEGNPSLWHLASVLAWLGEVRARPVDGVLLEVARTAMELNVARQARQLPGAVLPKALLPLV